MKIGQTNFEKKNTPKFKGSNPIPRYLYHFTTESRLNDIEASKFILPHQADASGANIFMIDLINFFSKWTKIVFNFQKATVLRATGNPNNEPLFFNMDKLLKKTGLSKSFLGMLYPNNLMQSLISQTNPNMLERTCVLRIPTKNLDKNKLFIRDQLGANNYVSTAAFKELMSDFMQHLQEVKQSLGSNWNIRTQEEYNRFFGTEFNKFISNDTKKLVTGDNAKNAPLYRMKGKAFEYLYREPISVNDIQVLNVIDVNRAASRAVQTPTPYRTLFELIFEGHGEQIAARKLIES